MGTAVRMMRECGGAALAAQCQGVPLSLQLQFTAIIARHQGCGGGRGGGAGEAEGDQTQSPASCFCARVANVLARLCSCVHVVLCGSSPPLLFFFTVVMTQSTRGTREMDDVLLQRCRWCVSNKDIEGN